MTVQKGSLRVCTNGHKYYKNSDCPVCPLCEAYKKEDSGFMKVLAAPARRALQSAGILQPTQLSEWTEARLLQLHGMGPSAVARLKQELGKNGIALKKG